MNAFQWFLVFSAPSFLLVYLGLPILLVALGLVIIIGLLCIDFRPIPQRIVVLVFLPGGPRYA